MLVFNQLLSKLEDPQEKLALIAEKIDNVFAAVFRQVAMYRFEQQAHQMRREQGELPIETINSIWQQTAQGMFGDSLTLGEEHAWWWMFIPHIFRTPFYVYSYAFGQLLVFALYNRYKQEGQPFVERYIQMLSAGSSASAADILRIVGVDINDRNFWLGGITPIRDMVQQAKGLATNLTT